MADDLSQLDAWFGRILEGLAPGQRRGAAIKLGQALRRSNLARIAANVEPDGSAMAPRLPGRDRRGRLRTRSKAKMFRRLRQARRVKIDADPEGVELSFASGRDDRIAAVHHFGQEDSVGRSRTGRTIRTRYAARQLFGFSDDDMQISAEVAEAMLSAAPAR